MVSQTYHEQWRGLPIPSHHCQTIYGFATRPPLLNMYYVQCFIQWRYAWSPRHKNNVGVASASPPTTTGSLVQPNHPLAKYAQCKIWSQWVHRFGATKKRQQQLSGACTVLLQLCFDTVHDNTSHYFLCGFLAVYLLFLSFNFIAEISDSENLFITTKIQCED